MPDVLQVTDKGPDGGGIVRVVERHRALLGGTGWRVSCMRIGGPQRSPGPDEWSIALQDLRRAVRSDALAAAMRPEHAVDAIHLHLGFDTLPSGFVRQLAARAPLIVSLHDVSPFPAPASVEPAGLRDRILRQALRPIRRIVWNDICRFARRMLCPSRYLAGLAIAHGFPQSRVTVLPHAVAVPSSSPEAPSACGPVALFAGLLSVAKGGPLLIDAFARVRVEGAQLILLGDGPARPEMERRVARLGLAGRVYFRGAVPPVEVARAIGRARLLIHPSLVAEGFGLVGPEAMAQGRSVAGFATGGATEWLIDGVTGLVARPRDADGLAGAIERLLRDDALADNLGADARRHVAERFDERVVRRGLLVVLDECRMPVRAARG